MSIKDFWYYIIMISESCYCAVLGRMAPCSFCSDGYQENMNVNHPGYPGYPSNNPKLHSSKLKQPKAVVNPIDSLNQAIIDVPKLLVEDSKNRKIVHAFFSQYQHLESKDTNDTYYQTPKANWVKTTAIYKCVSFGRADQMNNLTDSVYLGPVYEDTKIIVPRGSIVPSTANQPVVPSSKPSGWKVPPRPPKRKSRFVEQKMKPVSPFYSKSYFSDEIP